MRRKGELIRASRLESVFRTVQDGGGDARALKAAAGFLGGGGVFRRAEDVKAALDAAYDWGHDTDTLAQVEAALLLDSLED